MIYGTPYTLAGVEEAVTAFVADALDIHPEDFGACAACGVILDDELIAGVVYSDYRPLKQGASMQASIASVSPRWATRKVLRSLFAYPFTQMEVSRLWAYTARKNKKARDLLDRLGFKYEGMARRGYDGRQDAATFGMLPHECRWL